MIDKATFAGIVIAIGAIACGLLLEGGQIGQIIQPTAAVIVFGGTLGVVLIQFPLAVLRPACRLCKAVLLEDKRDHIAEVGFLIGLADKARRQGIVSLEAKLNSVTDPFLRKALVLAIDGTNTAELRKIMEFELEKVTEEAERYPQVFESAGGFAPTIGIIGAVLGLIQVMQHLENIEAVGRGIAMSFVATLYGVAAANLLLLPAAGKMRLRLRERQAMREMTLAAVVSISEGVNPRMLETQLVGLLADSIDHESRAEGHVQ